MDCLRLRLGSCVVILSICGVLMATWALLSKRAVLIERMRMRNDWKCGLGVSLCRKEAEMGLSDTERKMAARTN
jgi:hypothetical protein